MTLAVLAALSAPLWLTSSALAEPTAPPRAVRVGVYQNEPKVFMDDQGRASGIFIDLLAEIARGQGWSLQFVPCRWSECLHELEDGRIDLMPDVAYSREREQRFDFNHTTVLESWSQVYAAPGASIGGLSDLRGKRVAVLQDAVQRAAFEQMVAGFGIAVTIVPTQSFEEAFQDVRDGKADAAIANHLFGDYFFRQFGLVRTSIVFEAAQLHYAAAEGRNADLLNAIDGRLDAWRREPNSTYYAELARWMDRPPVAVVPPRVLWLIGVAAGMLVVAGGLIVVLRRRVRRRTQHLEKANEELRKAEAALREREALLNSTQRLGRVGGWEWDIDKGVATWTEETYRLHGVQREDAADSSRDLMDRSLACYEAEARDAVREAFERCCEQGQPYDLEAPFRPVSGRRLWVRTTAEAVRDPHGKIVKVVGNIMDITERKTAEEERRAIEEQHKQSQKMEAIGRLAGGVAHDFNNLLTVIINYSELALRRVNEGDPLHVKLTQIARAGERAAALTQQLLAFSRTQVLELKPVDINQIARNLEGMLRRIIGEDIQLDMTLAPDLGMTIADRSQVEQVLMNLVVNARDAMPSGGKLTIETANADLDEAYASQHVGTTPGAYVMLGVCDSGLGMDEQTRARIFEPFFTTKERGKGTGLGLATVYGIVSQCGGHIRVDSEPGRGATFRIYLRREDSVAATAPSTHPPASASTGTETVLLVEDEEAVRDVAARILRSSGYQVLVAANAEEAVKASETHDGTIELLLTDVIMPGTSGEQLAEKLAAARPRMRVLFMSGYFDSVAPGSGVSDPRVRFIQKPMGITSLGQKVRETLDGH